MLRLSEKLSVFAEKYMPSPFVITLFLTLLVVLLAIFVQGSAVIETMSFWQRGFWDLLKFTMQMSLILVLGYALASTDLFQKLIQYVISPIKSTEQAVLYISFLAMLMSFLNWGLGLVFGAILARKFAEHAQKINLPINYPIVGASAYAGLIIWHGGFSGSAPLTVAGKNHFLSDKIGSLSVAETILSWQNLLVTLLLLILIPAFLYFLAERVQTKPYRLEKEHSELSDESTHLNFNDRLDNSRLLSLFLGGSLLLYLIYFAVQNADSLKFINLNYVNFLLLALGLLLHRSLLSYANTFDKVVKSAGAIILLFPFYAGIMGIMKYSGLSEYFSSFIAASATEHSFPALTFMSSAIVNLVVPSGGGQWVVQGPILMEAAMQNSISIPQSIMAFSYGDELTNMLQPFWALPLLGITGLKAKEILPYSILIMLISIPLFLLGIYLF